MDITFSCPGCGISLEVESEAAGQQFDCPSCHKPIQVPSPASPGLAGGPPASQVAAAAAVPQPQASKIEKRISVPVTSNPVESLIQKPNKSLDAVSRDQKPGLRVKTIRHSDCKEVGKDKFDDTVSEFLNRIGDNAVVSITPISYSYVEMATQKLVTDFGVMVVYRA
jgi:hypothetical protein